MSKDSKDEDLQIGDKTWKKSAEPIQKDGFREGYEAGRMDSFQEGFDIGYSQGFKAAFDMGYYNAALRSADDSCGPDESRKLNLDGRLFEKPGRGGCVLCPKLNRTLTKTDMANAIPSEDTNISDIVHKQSVESLRLRNEKETAIKWLDSLLVKK